MLLASVPLSQVPCLIDVALSRPRKPMRRSCFRRVALVVLAVLVACVRPVYGGGSACVGELDGDSQVGGSDLALLLSNWGGNAPDLDGDGLVGGSDLAVMLGAWGECAADVTISGHARFTDGASPTAGTVTTSLGGSTSIDANGAFTFTIAVPVGTRSFGVAAAASRLGIAHAGDVVVVLDGSTKSASVTVFLSPEVSCSDAGWQHTFGGAVGLAGGLSGPGNPLVSAIEQFDDGSGSAIFVGGNFRTAGGAVVNSVGKWDGTRWHSTGVPVEDGYWYDFEAFDAGDGAKLYAVMRALPFHQGVMRWTGDAWEPVGAPFQLGSGTQFKLLGYDDGGGRQLYVGGSMQAAAGVSVGNIARWNGVVWSAVGVGFDGSVRDLAEFDDGSGPALYAVGSFTFSGSVAVSGIAKWDGSAWQPVGGGLASSSQIQAHALAVFDDGDGARLYVAGNFSSAGGVPANKCASWDGKNWRAENLPTTPIGSVNTVRDLEVFDSGSGAALYVGFQSVGSSGGGLLRRSGQNAWSSVASFSGFVNTLQRVTIGGSPALCMGHFGALYSGYVDPPNGGRVDTNSIVAWDGVNWTNFGDGMSGAPVNAVITVDDGSGPSVILGGNFRSVGDTAVDKIARWRDGEWSSFGSGMNGEVHALVGFDDGAGAGVVAAGDFTSAGGLTRNRVALWRNGQWQALGAGFSSGSVHALAVFNGELYAAGSISGRIARFTGGSWQIVGGGTNGTVRSLVVLDVGDGPRLYAGGEFSVAGSTSASRVAWWDGTSWTGVPGIASGNVFSLGSYDSGSGPALVAGGNFSTGGSSPIRSLALLSSSGWAAIGGGMPSGSQVNAVVSVRAPDGPLLYIGGSFTSVASVSAANIARWNGAAWSPVSTGTSGAIEFGISQNTVCALGVMAGASGPSVVVAGSFPSSPGGDSFVARIGCDDK